MSDGAHLGISAGRALGTILGGEPQPTDDEKMSPDAFRQWILDCPEDWDVDTGEPGYDAYSECSRYVAHVLLTLFLSDLSLASVPTELDYDWDADPDRGAQGIKDEFIRHPGLSRTIKSKYPEADAKITGLGITGFMWGWAVNAARMCVELPPVPNPAIMTIETKEQP